MLHETFIGTRANAEDDKVLCLMKIQAHLTVYAQHIFCVPPHLVKYVKNILQGIVLIPLRENMAGPVRDCLTCSCYPQCESIFVFHTEMH